MRDYEERRKQEQINEMIKQRARDSKLQEYQEFEQAREIEQYNNPQQSQP